MQLFLRCGGAVGTVAVHAEPTERFEALTDRLGSGATAESSGQVVSVFPVCLACVCSTPFEQPVNAFLSLMRPFFPLVVVL